MTNTLTVEVAGRKIKLVPGAELTFGRDRTCDVCLDHHDVGISRVSGRVVHDQHGWAVVNLSRKRALHILDGSGFVVPLPVVAADGYASRRTVDQQTLTILVAGEQQTHAVALHLAIPPAQAPDVSPPADPVSTRTQTPSLTDRRREVLVAMASGYLQPYPQYDPRPLTYRQVADLLGLSKRQVMKRVEHVRQELVAARVPGLEGEVDARRALCEWLLATRTISPDDLRWLLERADVVTGRLGSPPGRPKAAGNAADPTTAHPIHDRVTRIAERTARQIAPALRARLREQYGARWLRAINDRQPGVPAGHGLSDYRRCLSTVAYDPAIQNWVDGECQRSARELCTLANAAVHRQKLEPADVDRASRLAATVLRRIPTTG